MKLLLVAMSDSIHTARWVSQLADQGWEIHVFACNDNGITSSELKNVTVHHLFHAGWAAVDRTVRLRGVPLFSDFTAYCSAKVVERFCPDYFARRLASMIRRIKPDIIHSLEIQHAGYLTLAAQKRLHGKIPPWIVTNWGSDISLFGRLPEHEPKIREVLANCDFYSCECRRDVCLAKSYGFTGHVFPVFPNGGGFDLAWVSGAQSTGPVSDRKTILLKGYQHWAGRALVGLRALERCSDLLGDYEVVIYSASPEVSLAAGLFMRQSGIAVKVLPSRLPHHELLRWHGRARISIGLSIGDAISTSFLEALVMGSFPIQSWTSCADEWVEDGITGFLVPPEDPDLVESAIRKALTDDELVNNAARINIAVATERLDFNKIKKHAVDMYRHVVGQANSTY